MDWLKMLSEIFEVCIIPLLGILTAYLVNYIKLRGGEVINSMENELEKKYLRMLINTVNQCVIATNQTYVEALKKQGKFDIEAQKHAFQLTYAAVLQIIGDEGKEYLANIVGDLQEYITQLIEAEVNRNKV